MLFIVHVKMKVILIKMKDIIKCFIIPDISNINDDIFEINKTNQNIDPKIQIFDKKKKVKYQDNNKIIKEYFFEDKNSLLFSFIKYTGDCFDNELIGYKFCYEINNKKDNIILIKNPIDYYPNFIFYNNLNKNIQEIVQKHIFQKIDYNNFNIGGSKIYLYFYLTIFEIKNKKELNENKIKIIVIDEIIDSYIPNYIKQKKSNNINEDDYLNIYLLLFKEHVGILFFFNDNFYLFDSSLYFISKFENVFKSLCKSVKILNQYNIQNLGSCTFHSIAFLEIALLYIFKDKKNFISNINVLINSSEFIFEYINKLNNIIGGKEEKIIFRSEEKVSVNYYSLNNNIYLNQKSFKFSLINYPNLFDFLKINQDNDTIKIILEENSLYLATTKLLSIYKNVINLLSSKIIDIEKKCEKLYYKNKFKLKYNNIYLKNEAIEQYLKIIDKFFIIDNENIKRDLKCEIKEEIREELITVEEMDKYKNNEINNKKDINNLIQELEGQLILQYFTQYSEEFDYYYSLNNEVINRNQKLLHLQIEIIKTIEKYNVSKIKYNDIFNYIKKQMKEINEETEKIEKLMNVFN